MTAEETIVAELIAKFPAMKDQARIQRPRRIWAKVERASLAAVFDYLVRQAGFVVYCTVTGLDEGETLAAVYHLARTSGIVLNLQVNLPKSDPVLQSITPYFSAADVSERELVDLLGFQVEGLPAGDRYPLTDDWPAGQYPLRKDWKPTAS